ncbi:hypothetical protein [Roseomonas sp. 18066]|uniref:hypothetical protein n=1 Tax=Roseomonas sp. 18066 TaxID=2681412 RepID=UPI00135A5FCF|nr:hypothetical protein [Roseomonas sp. 18066]
MPIDAVLRCQLETLIRAAMAHAVETAKSPRIVGAEMAEAWFAQRYGHRVACSEEDITELLEALASIAKGLPGIGASDLLQARAIAGATEQLLHELEHGGA